jgi:ACR3 family arsenite transporter
MLIVTPCTDWSLIFTRLVLAVLTNRILRNKRQSKENLISNLSVLPIIFLSLALVAMFASQAKLLLDNLDVMWQITIPILLFFAVNLFISQAVHQLL